MDESEVQFQKAYSPRDVTELGMDMELREVQELKAYSPMDVTELGISIETRLEHFLNA